MMQSLIIGAGSIGQGYDDKASAQVLTHAGAHYRHPDIDFLGFIDSAVERGTEAARKWNCQYLGPKLVHSVNVDLVVVAASTPAHSFLLKQILCNCSPRAVLVEKPFCSDAQEAREIVRLFGNQSIPILVNYSRNYLSSVRAIRSRQEDLGPIRFVRFRHYDTFENSGSHALALVLFLLGQPFTLDNLSHLDSGQGVILTTARAESTGLSFPLSIERFLGKQYHPWDLEMVFEGGTVRILERGGPLIIHSSFRESNLYPGYFEEFRDAEIRPDPSEAMVNATENLVSVAKGREEPLFDGTAGLSVRFLLDKLSTKTGLE